jgi:hypothetical protein
MGRAGSGLAPHHRASLASQVAEPAAAPRARRRVDEGRPLGELLAAHLALAPGGALKAHALREYADAGAEALTIVMRQELRPVRRAPRHPAPAWAA